MSIRHMRYTVCEYPAEVTQWSKPMPAIEIMVKLMVEIKL